MAMVIADTNHVFQHWPSQKMPKLPDQLSYL